MQHRTLHISAVALAATFLATTVFAQQVAPNNAAQSGNAPATEKVSPEQYQEMKQELDTLKHRVDAQDQKLASTTRPTTQPAAGGGTPAPGASDLAPAQSGSLGEKVKSLFAPKTEDEYFSPFDIMNPANMRPDMSMQIGSVNDMNLYMGFQTVGRFQGLQQQNVSIDNVSQAGLDPGFQDPFANLSLLAQIPNKLDVFADFYVASRPHPNTMYGHEGYLLFHQLPAPFDTGPLAEAFNYINLKVGAFDIDYGDGNYRRSNNAFVQRNPLIGNPLVDPNTEEIGAEIYTIKGPIYGLFGVGSGTTTEHFDYGSQPSFHGKLWAYPLPDVRTSVSAYHVDLAESGDTSYLYTAGRSGGSYAAVFGGGDDPGQILPRAGKDVTGVQGDILWNRWPFEFYANVGWTQDTDINGTAPGNPAERWLYGDVEPVYHITPALYAAGRYSYALAESVNGVPTDGWVDRVEIGGGYWFTRSILGKVEYVYEQYHGFSAADGLVSGVDASRSPRFSGVVVEVSFQF